MRDERLRLLLFCGLGLNVAKDLRDVRLDEDQLECTLRLEEVPEIAFVPVEIGGEFSELLLVGSAFDVSLCWGVSDLWSRESRRRNRHALMRFSR